MPEMPKPPEQEPLLLHILAATKDGLPLESRNYNQLKSDSELKRLLSKNIDAEETNQEILDNIADRVACLLHLKMLRGTTSFCNNATIVIQINDKDRYFISRCKNKKWTGEWQTPEMRKQAYINATERLAFLNNF